MKGPAVFLAQFMSGSAPFDTLASAARWMAEAGYVGVKIPTRDGRCIDLAKAAESQDYCDDDFAGGSDPGHNRKLLGLT